MGQRVGGVALRPGRVRRDLRPVDRDHPEPDHPRLVAQPQHLREQARHRVLVGLDEPGDRGMVRHQQPTDHLEPGITGAGPLDRPRRLDPDRMRVDRQGQHHRRVVRRATLPIDPIPGVEPGQVQLVDHVQHMPDQIVLRQPLPKINRQQHRLIPLRHTKIPNHTP
jgi:hypothetical protein